MKKLILTAVALFATSAIASPFYTQVSFKGAWKAGSEAQAVNAAIHAIQLLEQGEVSWKTHKHFRVQNKKCADISRDVIARSQFKRKMRQNGQVRNARISVGTGYDRNGNPSYTSTVKASVPCIKKRNSDDD